MINRHIERAGASIRAECAGLESQGSSHGERRGGGVGRQALV